MVTEQTFIHRGLERWFKLRAEELKSADDRRKEYAAAERNFRETGTPITVEPLTVEERNSAILFDRYTQYGKALEPDFVDPKFLEIALESFRDETVVSIDGKDYPLGKQMMTWQKNPDGSGFWKRNPLTQEAEQARAFLVDRKEGIFYKRNDKKLEDYSLQDLTQALALQDFRVAMLPKEIATETEKASQLQALITSVVGTTKAAYKKHTEKIDPRFAVEGTTFDSFRADIPVLTDRKGRLTTDNITTENRDAFNAGYDEAFALTPTISDADFSAPQYGPLTRGLMSTIALDPSKDWVKEFKGNPFFPENFVKAAIEEVATKLDIEKQYHLYRGSKTEHFTPENEARFANSVRTPIETVFSTETGEIKPEILDGIYTAHYTPEQKAVLRDVAVALVASEVTTIPAGECPADWNTEEMKGIESVSNATVMRAMQAAKEAGVFIDIERVNDAVMAYAAEHTAEIFAATREAGYETPLWMNQYDERGLIVGRTQVNVNTLRSGYEGVAEEARSVTGRALDAHELEAIRISDLGKSSNSAYVEARDEIYARLTALREKEQERIPAIDEELGRADVPNREELLKEKSVLALHENTGYIEQRFQYLEEQELAATTADQLARIAEAKSIAIEVSRTYLSIEDELRKPGITAVERDRLISYKQFMGSAFMGSVSTPREPVTEESLEGMRMMFEGTEELSYNNLLIRAFDSEGAARVKEQSAATKNAISAYSEELSQKEAIFTASLLKNKIIHTHQNGTDKVPGLVGEIIADAHLEKEHERKKDIEATIQKAFDSAMITGYNPASFRKTNFWKSSYNKYYNMYMQSGGGLGFLNGLDRNVSSLLSVSPAPAAPVVDETHEEDDVPPPPREEEEEDELPPPPPSDDEEEEDDFIPPPSGEDEEEEHEGEEEEEDELPPPPPSEDDEEVPPAPPSGEEEGHRGREEGEFRMAGIPKAAIAALTTFNARKLEEIVGNGREIEPMAKGRGNYGAKTVANNLSVVQGTTEKVAFKILKHIERVATENGAVDEPEAGKMFGEIHFTTAQINQLNEAYGKHGAISIKKDGSVVFNGVTYSLSHVASTERGRNTFVEKLEKHIDTRDVAQLGDIEALEILVDPRIEEETKQKKTFRSFFIIHHLHLLSRLR